MSESIDCRAFQRKLDQRSAGRLPDQEQRLLRAHAEHCRDCGTLLRMQEHLAAASQEELERLVPDELVDGMFDRVLETIEERSRDRIRLSDFWRPRAFLVPALSAAVVLLLIGSGWMFGQLRSVQSKGHELSLRLERQESQLQHVAPFASSSIRAEEPIAPRLRDWRRSLTGADDMSVAELRRLLERVPATTSVLTPREAELLLTRIEGWLNPSQRQAIACVQAGDGIAAAELLEILLQLDLDAEMEIPTARVLSLTRRFPSSVPGKVERKL